LKKRWLSLFLIPFLILATSCSSQTIQNNETKNLNSNPTVEKILSQSPEADIFVKDGIVYQNAKEIKWVKDLKLTKGDEVLSITGNSKKGEKFKDGMASKLPTGTKIYKPVEKNGPILIAVVDGKEIRYLGLVEG
jgi:hypothetical protein